MSFDPSRSTAERLDALEQSVRELREKPIDIRRLPMSKLQNRLTADWQPDPREFLPPGLIQRSHLADDIIDSSKIEAGSITYTDVDSTLYASLGYGHSPEPPVGTASTYTTGAVNRVIWQLCPIRERSTITGIGYLVAGTNSGNIRSAIGFDGGAGAITIVGERTTNDVAGGTLRTHHVSFDAAVTVNPGYYFLGLWFSSATHTALGAAGGGYYTSTTDATPFGSETFVYSTDITVRPAVWTF